MITNKQINEVITSGMSTPSNFQIKASGKAFSILTSNLYSRKIHAILRELGCNAIDAHKSAGKDDLPFDVVLPTSLLKEFRLRDFGTGISEDDIAKVYTVLFESTKDTSNDAIGCLGLGSKTPFSYTSSFVVKSFQNGLVKTYSMYVAPDGCPCYSKVGEKETDEGDGLLIQFAVEPNDVYRFQEACKDIYKWFEVKPNIVNSDIDLDMNYDVTHEGDNYKIIERGAYNSHLVMGNIAYPLKQYKQEIASRDTEKDIKLVSAFLDSHVLIGKVDIGTFDIAPSREEMSLDDISIDNITQYIVGVINDYKQKWVKGLESIFKSKSYFTACNDFAKYSDSIMKLFSDLEKQCIHEASGKTISEAISLANKDTEEMNIKCYKINNRGNGKYSMVESFNGVIAPHRFYGTTTNEEPKCKFYVKKDDSKSVVKKIRHYLLNTCNPSYYDSAYQIILIEEKDLDTIVDMFGIPNDLINDIEDLPVPTSSSSSRYSNYTPKEGTVTKDSVRGDVMVIYGDSNDDNDLYSTKFIPDCILEKDLDNVFFSENDFRRMQICGSYSHIDNFANDLHTLLNVDEGEDIYLIYLKTESSYNKPNKKWDSEWKQWDSEWSKAISPYYDIINKNKMVNSFTKCLKEGCGSLSDYFKDKVSINVEDLIEEVENEIVDNRNVPKSLINGSGSSYNLYVGYNNFTHLNLHRKYNGLTCYFDKESADAMMDVFIKLNPNEFKTYQKAHAETVKDIWDRILNKFTIITDEEEKFVTLLKQMRSNLDLVCEKEIEESEENVLTECV